MFEQLVDTAQRAKRRDPGSGLAEELEGLAWQHLREAEPIRISHAQEVLGISNQTVRAWIEVGILDDRGGSPQRVGLESVIRARLVADELREQGRDRELMSAVLSRLDALALEDEDEFQQSVGQMRRRRKRPRPY